MKRILMTIVFISAFLISGSALADSIERAINNFKLSETTHPFFENAFGYAVFPTVGKGGLGVGMAFGKGLVYRRDVATGVTTLTQFSIGGQAGGQAFSEIIFFEDERAYNDFTGGNFEFSAGASAVAITIGAQAQTTTTGNSASAGSKQKGAHYKKGMAVFTYVKGGFMVEAVLAGQKFTFVPMDE